MKEASESRISRREVLKTGAVAVLGAGTFCGIALEELKAAAQKANKMIFTTEAFTNRIPPPQKKEEFRKELGAIRKDLIGYIDTHFHLVPEQMANLKKIPRKDIDALNKALTVAEEKGLRVIIRTEIAAQECARVGGFRLKTIEAPGTLTVRAYAG